MRPRRFCCVFGVILLCLAASGALCASENPAGKTIDKTFVFEGKEYPYKIYLPTGCDGKKKYPVIVSLHGLGANIQSYASVGPAISRENYIIVTPQAPFPYGPGFSWLAQDAQGNSLPSLELSEKIVLAALDDAIANYNGDRDSVFLTGLSQGGHMTFVMGMRNCKRFKGLIPCAGCHEYFKDLIGDSLEKAKGIPILQLVGRQDQDKGEGLYPINLKENKILREKGYDARVLTYPIGHTLDMRQLRDINDWIQLRLTGRSATGEIVKDLETAEGFDRLPLIISLAMNDDEDALGFVEQLIKEGKSNDEMCAAATGLILNRNDRADALLKALLENRDDQVRITTLHAIGMRGVEGMSETILKILEDTAAPRQVRTEAFAALQKYGEVDGSEAMNRYVVVAVSEVTPEGQAAAAGMKAGDIIVEYDGEKIKSQQQLLNAIQAAAQKQGVKVVVERDGNRLEFELKGGQLGIRVNSEVRLP